MVFYDQDHTCLTEADIKLQTKFANVFANPYLRITRMDGGCITRADYINIEMKQDGNDLI